MSDLFLLFETKKNPLGINFPRDSFLYRFRNYNLLLILKNYSSSFLRRFIAANRPTIANPNPANSLLFCD